MFFLVRMVFWLAVVLALLPSGGAKPGAAAPSVTATCGQAGAGMLHGFLPAPTSIRGAAPDRQPEARAAEPRLLRCSASRRQGGREQKDPAHCSGALHV